MAQNTPGPDASFRSAEGEALADAFILRVKADHCTAPLSPRDRAMIDYVLKLTRTPAAVTRSDVDGLRSHGFDDAAIHDIAQVTALFSYYNRLADGLGIDPEPDHPHPRDSGAPA